jgi:hypothetical protein
MMTVYASPDAEVTEKLAALAHEQWSGWMKYMFSKCQSGVPTGTVEIPPDLVSRWQRQMLTPYAELPESEKQSDRDEATRMLKTLNELSPAGKKALAGMLGVSVSQQLEEVFKPFGKSGQVGALIGGLFGAALMSGLDDAGKPPKVKCVVCHTLYRPGERHGCLEQK